MNRISLTDLFCMSCGKFITRSLPNSSHRCWTCGDWTTFKDGKPIKVESADIKKSA